jgi:hypothetical protein
VRLGQRSCRLGGRERRHTNQQQGVECRSSTDKRGSSAQLGAAPRLHVKLALLPRLVLRPEHVLLWHSQQRDVPGLWQPSRGCAANQERVLEAHRATIDLYSGQQLYDRALRLSACSASGQPHSGGSRFVDGEGLRETQRPRLLSTAGAFTRDRPRSRGLTSCTGITHPAAASRPVDLGDQERAEVVADLAIFEVELKSGKQADEAAIVSGHRLTHPIAVASKQVLSDSVFLLPGHRYLPCLSPGSLRESSAALPEHMERASMSSAWQHLSVGLSPASGQIDEAISFASDVSGSLSRT